MIFGALFIVYLIVRTLMKIFKTVEKLVHYIELKVYYPLVSRIIKSKQKEYVRKYLKNLIMRASSNGGIGIKYDIDIAWSNEERALLDLEKGVLLIRVPYATNVREVIAKALLMASPYAISQYLEPVFGTKLAQILSVAIARDYASRDINILREFKQYVDEIYKDNNEFRELVEYIDTADDMSLYKHIVLFELKKVLEMYDGRVNSNWLEEDVRKLIRVVGSLQDIRLPLVCGHSLYFNSNS